MSWTPLTTPPTWNVTDQELLKRLQYHLLENASGVADGATFATPMFTQAQLLAAMNQRQEKFIRDTACVLARAGQATIPQVSRYALPPDWIHTRRLAWGTQFTPTDNAIINPPVPPTPPGPPPLPQPPSPPPTGVPQILQLLSGSFDASNATRSFSFPHACAAGHFVFIFVATSGNTLISNILDGGVGNPPSNFTGPDNSGTTSLFLLGFRMINPAQNFSVTLVAPAQMVVSMFETNANPLGPLAGRSFGAMTHASAVWGDGSAGNPTPTVNTNVPGPVPSLLVAIGASETVNANSSAGIGWTKLDSQNDLALQAMYSLEFQAQPAAGIFGFTMGVSPAIQGGAYLLALQS